MFHSHVNFSVDCELITLTHKVMFSVLDIESLATVVDCLANKEHFLKMKKKMVNKF